MKFKTKVVKWIKNPSSIMFILGYHGLLNWVGDKRFIKIQYRLFAGESIDLLNPQKFSEKLQWLKLYDRKEVYTIMVDKYAAKQYVERMLGPQYVIPTYGVYQKFEEIDFGSLPEQFVIKCTHDSGGLVVCRSKPLLNLDQVKNKIESSLKHNYYLASREWPYKNVQKRIIIEEYLQEHDDSNRNGLTDYKFYCFNGEPKFLYVSCGLDNHETARMIFLTLDWKILPFQRPDYRAFENLPIRPDNFDEMVVCARTLATGVPFLRVDLYSIDSQVKFSELTFYPCGGMMPLEPAIWDEKLGVVRPSSLKFMIKKTVNIT